MRTTQIGRFASDFAWVVGCGLLLAGVTPAEAQYGARNGECRSYGGDVGSTKYSPLDQITRDNFEQLEIA